MFEQVVTFQVELCWTLAPPPPQGCVLSPIFFVLYTYDLCWNSNTGCVSFVKYADDTIIVGLISNDDDSELYSY